MKKTLLVLLMAGLLLISATACSSGTEESDSGTETTERNPGNDPLGSGTETDTETDKETETEPDITEDPANFEEASLEVIVLVEKATLRNAPAKNDDSYVTTVKKDFVMTATGESDNWYRVTLEDYDDPCYIAKSVARDKAVIDAFVDGDPVTIKMTGVSEGNEEEIINVRTYPSADSNLNDGVKVGTIAEGDTVIRVSENDGWSKILFKGKDDTEEKIYYVSSDFFTVVEENTETSGEA